MSALFKSLVLINLLRLWEVSHIFLLQSRHGISYTPALYLMWVLLLLLLIKFLIVFEELIILLISLHML